MTLLLWLRQYCLYKRLYIKYVEINLICDYPEILLLSQSQLAVVNPVLLKQAKCLSLKTAAMSSTPWKYHLRRVTIVAPKVAQRVPRWNFRDPRFPSYRPPSPTRLSGHAPVEIPLEYTPRLDARIPVRKLGTERRTRVLKLPTLNTDHKLFSTIFISKGTKSTPNMGKIMAEMTAIHTAPTHPRKLVGKFVKATKPTKGSINLPIRRLPRIPRLPPSPPLSETEALKKKSAENKAKIFSLSDSDTEVDSHIVQVTGFIIKNETMLIKKKPHM